MTLIINRVTQKYIQLTHYNCIIKKKQQWSQVYLCWRWYITEIISLLKRNRKRLLEVTGRRLSLLSWESCTSVLYSQWKSSQPNIGSKRTPCCYSDCVCQTLGWSVALIFNVCVCGVYSRKHFHCVLISWFVA